MILFASIGLLLAIIFIYSHFKDNQTNTMKIYAEKNKNAYFYYDMINGIVYSIFKLGGFEYNGAITNPLSNEEYNISNNKNLKKMETMPCFEDNCESIYYNNSVSILGFEKDSLMTDIETTAGSEIGNFGLVVIEIGIASAQIEIVIVGAGLVIAGIFLVTDEHCIYTTPTSNWEYVSTATDVVLIPENYACERVYISIQIKY